MKNNISFKLWATSTICRVIGGINYEYSKNRDWNATNFSKPDVRRLLQIGLKSQSSAIKAGMHEQIIHQVQLSPPCWRLGWKDSYAKTTPIKKNNNKINVPIQNDSPKNFIPEAPQWAQPWNLSNSGCTGFTCSAVNQDRTMPEIYKNQVRKIFFLLQPEFPLPSLQPKTNRLLPGSRRSSATACKRATAASPAPTWDHQPRWIHLVGTTKKTPNPTLFSAPGRELANKWHFSTKHRVWVLFEWEDGRGVSADLTAELVNLYAKYSAWS